MSPTPIRPTADLQQANADLQRQLAEARAELFAAERDEDARSRAAQVNQRLPQQADVIGLAFAQVGDMDAISFSENGRTSRR